MTDLRRPRRAPAAVDASMSLLNEVMYHPVDAGYAEAAQHVRAPLSGPRRVADAGVRVLVAAALGLVTAVAVVSLRTPEPSAIGARELLGDQIAERTAQADALQDSNAALAAEVSRRQAEALASMDPALRSRLEEAEVQSGAAALRGPGLVLEVADAQGDPDSADPASRVQDVDLQIVTNALWASGAEAIAINGQRLTALSPIRAVGPAIFVDLVPLVGPYRIEAIGDAQRMQTAFARTSAANHLTTLAGTYGIETSLKAAGSLELPGSGPTTLRYATVPSGDVASSGFARGDEPPAAPPEDTGTEEGTP